MWKIHNLRSTRFAKIEWKDTSKNSSRTPRQSREQAVSHASRGITASSASGAPLSLLFLSLPSLLFAPSPAARFFAERPARAGAGGCDEERVARGHIHSGASPAIASVPAAAAAAFQWHQQQQQQLSGGSSSSSSSLSADPHLFRRARARVERLSSMNAASDVELLLRVTLADELGSRRAPRAASRCSSRRRRGLGRQLGRGGRRGLMEADGGQFGDGSRPSPAPRFLARRGRAAAGCDAASGEQGVLLRLIGGVPQRQSRLRDSPRFGRSCGRE